MNIAHISYQLGTTTETVQSLYERGVYSFNECLVYKKFMGLSKIPRHYNIHHYNQLDDLISQFLKEYAIEKEKVKYIFYTHTAEFTAPDHFYILHKIRKKFSFINSIASGTSLLKCASAFQVIQLCQAVFSNINIDSYIILLIADIVFTPILQHISGSTILGDAASLILLSNHHNNHQCVDTVIKIDDRFSRGTWCSHDESLLFQDVYVDTICQVILTILQKNHLTIENIQQIFPHNVNTISWHRIIKILGAKVSQFYGHNIERTGHCFGSDPFINLKDGILYRVIKPGDYYLLVTVGLGAIFSVILFRY